MHRTYFDIKIFLYWLPMIGLAILNGGFREWYLKRFLTTLSAQQLSTILLTLLCALYTCLVFPMLSVHTISKAFATGLAWMLLTILFEFGLGIVTGNTMEHLLEQYNMANGQVWPLFLFALLIMPLLCYFFRV